MDYRLLFPNDYIASHDLRGKDVTKTISKVVTEALRMSGGRSETKPVVLFSDSKKKLVLNKTNAKIIASIYGNDTAGWVGKAVTLYPTMTNFGTAKVDCVRVREGKPKQAPVPEEAMPDEDPFDVEGGEEVENEPEAGWEE